MLAVPVAGTTPAPTLRAPLPAATSHHAATAVDLAWAFGSDLADRLALRYDLGYGHAHVNCDVAASPNLNVVRVERSTDPRELAAHASELFGAGPRHILVRDRDVASTLRSTLLTDGYVPVATVVLERSGPAAVRPRTDVTLRPATGTDDADLEVRYWSQRYPSLSQAQVAQLRLTDVLRAEPATVRRLAVWAPSAPRGAGALTPVSRAVATTFEGATEISGVFTTPAHRGRGFARTVVTSLARSCRPGRVFAQVEATDPALAVLTAAGFAPAGVVWRFSRTA